MTEKMMLCPRCWGTKREPNSKPLRDCTYCGGDALAGNVQLSDHFWLDEFVESQNALRNALANDPPPDVLQELRLLCTNLLEPLRKHFGPIHIDSGYRSGPLNEKIGGVWNSVHRLGAAADVKPGKIGVKKHDLVDWMMKQDSLKFDQLIFEGTWVHVGRTSPEGNFRRQVLMMYVNEQGKTKYKDYDPKDRRVTS